MPMKSVDFIKTPFFLQIKEFINYPSSATLWQKNSFVVEVTFRRSRKSCIIKDILTSIKKKYTFKKDFIVK